MNPAQIAGGNLEQEGHGVPLILLSGAECPELLQCTLHSTFGEDLVKEASIKWINCIGY